MAETQKSNAERSVPELVKEIATQSAALARKELELAEAELAIKGKRAGLGVGMFGGAGLFGALVLLSFWYGAILAFALIIPEWAGALVVGGISLIIAGIAAMVGGFEFRRAKPLAPAQAAESVKDDVEWIKAHAERGRQ